MSPCTRTLTTALLLLGAAFPAHGQAPASDLDQLFDPGGRVPLSEFVDGADVPTGQALIMTVKPELLAAIATYGATLEVAQSSAGGTVFHTPTSVDPVTGLVTLLSDVDERFCVTTGALTNDFPLVTHWDATANNGRGGQVPGQHDAISTYELDLLDEKPGDLVTTGDSILNDDPAWDNPAAPSAGPYMFATNLYAIFSDGSELTAAKDGDVADRDVPDYENYIAENYAGTAISNEVAVWLSDKTRATSGWPIVHRNAHTAFDAMAPTGEQVQDLVPAFQVVHCFIVPNADDPAHPGKEESLATFLLPPFWERAPGRDYPVLFNGFYGINGSTVGTMGDKFLTALGELFEDHDRSAVGILWNGGGAGACQTMHRSAYDNMAELMDQADALVAADKQLMVISGGSRGGTTGLEMAANPYHSNYTARFVIANNPQSSPGEAIGKNSNPTYGLVNTTVADETGYQDGWKETWVDPVSGLSGDDIAMHVFLGSMDPAYIDANLANNSDPFLDALVSKGTQVIMRVGTHDFSRSFTHQARYYEALVAKGVPVRMEVSYRFGHRHTVGQLPDEVQLLNQVIDDDPSLATGLVHFKKASVIDYDTGVPFTPDHQPFIVEAPITTGLGQTHSWSFIGPPATAWEIHITKLDDVALFNSLAVVPVGPQSLLFSGVLPPGSGDFAWDCFELAVPYVPSAFGGYTYELRYWDPSGVMHTIGFGASAPPLLPQDPVMVLWHEQYPGVADESRTGGVASDVLW
jgi:hypothetical protein